MPHILKKTITYDFWKVATPSSFTGGFPAALKQLATISQIANRNETIGGNTLRWEELDTTGRYFYGDFLKLRMELLPMKGGLSIKSSNLGLNQNEGISELFAFMFDTQSDIFVCQYNHYGASINALIEYIHSKVNLGGPLYFHPVITENSLKKLNSMNDIRHFSYKIAKPTSPALNPNSRGTIEESIAIMDDLGAANIEILVTSGYTRKSMTIRQILAKTKALLSGTSTANASVEKIEVGGYSNGEKSVIDLIQDRMREKFDLHVGSNRTISYSDRKNSALKALNSRRQELISQFGPSCA